MNKLLRALVAVAAIAMSRPAPAAEGEPLATEQAIHAMIDSGRWYEARQETNRLNRARLIAGTPLRTDPVLDRLIGEMIYASAPGTARIMLERAVADATTRDRAHYALLLAQSEEVTGDEGAAENTYRRLLADRPQPQSLRQATVGLARLLLMTRPREALQLLRDLLATPGSPGERWEAELVASRAERILGMREDAAAQLELASQHAWYAPVGDSAIARVAQDRAVAAGLAGDRQTLIALTAVARGATHNDSVGQFVDLLPECGTHGIEPADFVIIELIPRMNGSPRVDLIYASQAEIAAPFLALVLGTPLQGPDGQAMSVLLRCATAPRPGGVETWDNPIVEWGVRIGIYPVLEIENSDDKTEMLESLAELESRLGADSPALIPILTSLLATPPAQPERPVQEFAQQQLGYARRLDSLLRAQNASADARLWASLAATALSIIAVQQPQQTAERMMRSLLQTSAADPTLTLETLLAMVEFVPSDSSVGPELKTALLTQALERMRRAGDEGDSRLRGLAVRLARLHYEAGDQAAAIAVLRTYGVAGDLCVTVETQPHFLSSDLRSQDYPSDAVRGNLHGMVGVDYRLDAQGGLHDVRAVFSGPPFIFDGATVDRAATIRQEPARSGGAARACRGAAQRIRWQLP